jgi:hypothetical protein
VAARELDEHLRAAQPRHDTAHEGVPVRPAPRGGTREGWSGCAGSSAATTVMA